MISPFSSIRNLHLEFCAFKNIAISKNSLFVSSACYSKKIKKIKGELPKSTKKVNKTYFCPEFEKELLLKYQSRPKESYVFCGLPAKGTPSHDLTLKKILRELEKFKATETKLPNNER